jgi:hypothetical protein
MSEPLLGCKAGELEVGMEFSADEGRTWQTVKNIKYVSEESDVLDIWCQPYDTTSLSATIHLELEDTQHVLLERTWGSEKT